MTGRWQRRQEKAQMTHIWRCLGHKWVFFLFFVMFCLLTNALLYKQVVNYYDSHDDDNYDNYDDHYDHYNQYDHNYDYDDDEVGLREMRAKAQDT